MTAPTTPLDQIINTPTRPRRKWILMLAAAAATTLLTAVLRTGGERPGMRYLAEPATLGPLTVTVSATGNLQPTKKVEVGSELSGLVASVLVDDNDRVQQGQELARLDTSRLEDQVAQNRAQVSAAEAQVQLAQATVTETRANLARLKEVAKLSGGKLPSRAELDGAEANLQRAVAGEANARAAVVQAQAALKSNQTHLAKASIRSPIDGVVLARQVEPGQTVAASLQAPVLFTLAENLAQMELQVDVDEADVGQVREGQGASFTVDTWPGRRYPARVLRVSFGSQTKDGVVSYKTLLGVDNADLSLRPGMTATAEIVTAQLPQALLVPNAALRFNPPAEGTAAQNVSFVSRLLPRPPPAPRRKSQNGDQAGPRVWLLRDGVPAAVAVTVGLSNRRYTEIRGGDLAAGAEVITETAGAAP